MSILYYVHDPMCSWCWGHREQWQLFQKQLPSSVQVKNVVGGLAPDNDNPMPIAQREAIAGYWRNIEELLGTKFNHDFWSQNTPRRSTYPSCRAAIAARWQDAEEEMILAIQEAYYLKAKNPSDNETHIAIAQDLGLDVEKFKNDLVSDELENAFIKELHFARSLPINGFPSMVLQHNERVYVIPLDYKDYRGGLEAVEEIIA